MNNRENVDETKTTNTKSVWLLFSRLNDQPYETTKLIESFNKKCNFPYKIIYIEDLFMFIQRDKLELYQFIEKERQKVKYPTVAFIRISTPKTSIDREISILKQLEISGTIVINSSESILKCINKIRHYQELAIAGFPIVPTISYCDIDLTKVVDFLKFEDIKFPAIIKNVRGNRGSTVFLCQTKDHFNDIRSIVNHESPYLFQEYIKYSHGKDVRVIVIGDKIIGAMLRQSTDGNVRSNCHQGGIGTAFNIDEKTSKMVIKVTQVLGLHIAGIDLLFNEDGNFYIAEVNNNVGFTAFDKSIGTSISDEIVKYINEYTIKI